MINLSRDLSNCSLDTLGNILQIKKLCEPYHEDRDGRFHPYEPRNDEVSSPRSPDPAAIIPGATISA